jgi:hypothetical protein
MTTRDRIDALDAVRFHALLQRRVGPRYGASVAPGGERAIWHDDGSRRRFVTAPTWSAVLYRAWQRWPWHVDGV